MNALEPSLIGEPPLRTLRRELARDLVENQRRGETALAPGVLFEDVPFYLDAERFAREQQRLFREMPLVACLSADLPEPGSYRTFDDAGVPMLLTRGKDGEVRAFLNVCPHRASRIVRDERGKASRFTCRFHGWTFDNAGKAVGIPEESRFCGQIDAQKHLVPCPAEERFGLIFVMATPGAAMDLDAHLGELARDLAAIGLETAEVVHADALPVQANWKYGLDTFFETYHLNSLHRETFKGLFSPVCVFDPVDPHHRYTFAPLNLSEWVSLPESEWQVDTIPLQYFLFPNTIVSVGSTSRSGLTVNVHQIFPQSADHFVSRLTYCAIGGVRSEEHRAEIEKAYQTSRAALVNEDYSVAAESHAGLPALPPGTRLPVGPQEIGVQNFHRNVKRLTA
ncbi:MAG: aromatic ring-hydroxylating dioxygenase subunit alpha [Sphingomonadales bacterium]|nr:aromatic ring-hydroxylating dioxygenase subunit alpha [Sphingomonadales bacterium]